MAGTDIEQAREQGPGVLEGIGRSSQQGTWVLSEPEEAKAAEVFKVKH